MFNNTQWLNQEIEDVIDPAREIIDPHHHLWARTGGAWRYDLDDLRRDTRSGHNVTKTIFMECSASYDTGGPSELRSVGEARFIAEMAAKSRRTDGQAVIAAMVGHVDLRTRNLSDILDIHHAASHGLLRGVRQSAAWTDQPKRVGFDLHAPRNLYAQAPFRAGLRTLGARGLSFDAWHFDTQNRDFLALARAVPDTMMILDHFGTPLGVGETRRTAPMMKRLKSDLTQLATCPNIRIKLGGMAMVMNGYDWHTRECPLSSDGFVAAQGDFYRFVIDTFGPERCMFESNFPMDKLSISYRSLWNAFKKISAPYSEAEKDDLFSGTAARVYKI